VHANLLLFPDKKAQISKINNFRNTLSLQHNNSDGCSCSHAVDSISDAAYEQTFDDNKNGIRIDETDLNDSPKRHNSMDQLIGMFNDISKSSRQRSLSDGDDSQPDLLNNTPPVPPKRSHRKRHTPPRPVSNGLPATPKVHMGACFSKVFNGCPLHINCTASWIHPDTRDQHIIIGAEEGIFNLNLNELHDAVIDQIYPRRTTWLYVIKDILMSLSGNFIDCFGIKFIQFTRSYNIELSLSFVFASF
jgi:hypothetical protein